LATGFISESLDWSLRASIAPVISVSTSRRDKALKFNATSSISLGEILERFTVIAVSMSVSGRDN